MTTARDVSRVEEIRNRCEHAIDAMRLPWAIRPYLAGECIIAKGSGNVTVCEFNEEDEPQTAFILNAPSDVRYLLAILADREAELGRVREALSKYGTHIPYCKAYRDEDGPCSCGLDAALSPGSGKEGA